MSRTGAQIKDQNLGNKTGFVDGTSYTGALVGKVEGRLQYTEGGTIDVKKGEFDFSLLSKSAQDEIRDRLETVLFPVA